MSAFLFDTLIWTAALIALVLVLRRPVTRWFGAPMAYALWCLPMLRLLLPPIELPAYLAPEKETQQPVAEILVAVDTSAISEVPLANALPSEQPGWFDMIAGLPWAELAMAVWLIGAGMFLYFRFSAYFKLRGELMQDAREVGKAKGPLGSIQLIETPGTNAPLAFGVLEPVIALPQGFMAQVDREARDLALAHELQHHRGADLLINILVQPLFALHWFNPLGKYGWLALRRDQEAACDARVMASRSKEERAVYANVIASFAAGPNVALAAPMACPVLGDKSIIQRLRNLQMTDASSNTKSRKLASRLMLGTAVLAIPLTASITYAEDIVPEISGPIAVKLPAAAPTVPAAPALSTNALQTSAKAPDALNDATAQSETHTAILTVDPDTGKTAKFIAKTEFETEADEVRIMKVNGKEVAVLTDFEEAKKDGVISRYEKVRIINDGDTKLSDAEMKEIMAEVRRGLAEADHGLTEMRRELKQLEKTAHNWSKEGQEGRTVIRMECERGNTDVATTREWDDGGTEVVICESQVMAHALKGLEEARDAIARNSEIERELREEILKEMDQKIKDWKKDAR